jgi:hypothetical protein
MPSMPTRLKKVIKRGFNHRWARIGTNENKGFDAKDRELTLITPPERLKKYCGHAVGKRKMRSLSLRFASTQSQAVAGMLLRQNFAQTQTSSRHVATVFF